MGYVRGDVRYIGGNNFMNLLDSCRSLLVPAAAFAGTIAFYVVHVFFLCLPIGIPLMFLTAPDVTPREVDATIPHPVDRVDGKNVVDDELTTPGFVDIVITMPRSVAKNWRAWAAG